MGCLCVCECMCVRGILVCSSVGTILVWAVLQHTDTSKNTKSWAVSQHTDTSKNTKAWAVSQHTDTSTLGLCHNMLTPARAQGLGCVTTH